MTKKLGIIGAGGAMGRAVKESAQAIFEIIEITEESNVSTLLSPPDIFVDFSTPAATMIWLAYATEHRIPFVSGTTGLSKEELETLQEKSSIIPILYASNFSIGIAVLRRAVSMIASILPDWDAEILEIHHRRKVDAPSGTALTLGETIASARGLPIGEVAKFSREGRVGPRTSGEIGFQAMRTGGVVGEHTVLFGSEHERIELIHRANDRKLFAAGAVQGAQWLLEQASGWYSIDDMLKHQLKN